MYMYGLAGKLHFSTQQEIHLYISQISVMFLNRQDAKKGVHPTKTEGTGNMQGKYGVP